MKNQILLSSRSEPRRGNALGNARSIICHRGGAWPGLLLVGCCAVLTWLAHPARVAVTEAWVHRCNNVVSNSIDQAYKVVSDAAGGVIITGFTEMRACSVRL
jgi:hypothetical protein